MATQCVCTCRQKLQTPRFDYTATQRKDGAWVHLEWGSREVPQRCYSNAEATAGKAPAVPKGRERGSRAEYPIVRLQEVQEVQGESQGMYDGS